MANYHGSGVLAADGDTFTIPIPQDGRQYSVVAEIKGTFVGTLQLQADGAGIATTAIASTGATAADPTAEGEFAADCGANAEEVGVVWDAYTSGEAEVRLTLIPQA